MGRGGETYRGHHEAHASDNPELFVLEVVVGEVRLDESIWGKVDGCVWMPRARPRFGRHRLVATCTIGEIIETLLRTEMVGGPIERAKV